MISKKAVAFWIFIGVACFTLFLAALERSKVLAEDARVIERQELKVLREGLKEIIREVLIEEGLTDE